MAGMPGTAPARRRAHRRPDAAGRVGHADRPAERSACPPARGRRLHAQRTSPGPTIRAVQGQLSRCGSSTSRSPTASPCTGTASTCRTRRTASPASPRTRCPRRRARLPVRRRGAGTYWYHSHQLSHEQVRRGLFGALVVDPPGAPPAMPPTWSRSSTSTPGGAPSAAGPASAGGRRARRAGAGAGGQHRQRADARSGSGGAVPGGRPRRHRRERARPRCSATAVLVTAGGRADLELVPPAGGAVRGRARRRGGAGASGRPAPPRRAARRPEAELDLLSYGPPAPLGFDPATRGPPVRLRVGRRPGFVDGLPGLGGRSTARCTRTCRCSWSRGRRGA